MFIGFDDARINMDNIYYYGPDEEYGEQDDSRYCIIFQGSPVSDNIDEPLPVIDKWFFESEEIRDKMLKQMDSYLNINWLLPEG